MTSKEVIDELVKCGQTEKSATEAVKEALIGQIITARYSSDEDLIIAEYVDKYKKRKYDWVHISHQVTDYN